MSLPGRICDIFHRRFLWEGSSGMIQMEREVHGLSDFLPGMRGPAAGHGAADVETAVFYISEKKKIEDREN